MQQTYHSNEKSKFPEKCPPVLVVKVWVDEKSERVFHNYSCPVCRVYHASLDLNTGIMQPCISCISKGYRVIQRPLKMVWWKRVLYRLAEIGGGQ